MNLADAIRQASLNAAATRLGPAPFLALHTNESFEERAGRDGSGQFEFDSSETEAEFRQFAESRPAVAGAQPASTAASRLELNLSPDQTGQLLRYLGSKHHEMLTLRETARILRLPTSAVRRLAEEGTLPGLSIEGRWRFVKTSIDEWIQMQILRKEEGHAA